MSPRLAFALETATAAGRATLELFDRGVAIDRKADSTPVTAADRQAERSIREAIGRSFPGEAILGEEEGPTGSGVDRWVIDPIDGTKSFICGVPLYATLLSYEVDAQPILGVCFLPALDRAIYAERGYGAYENGRPVRVSTVSRLEDATIASGGHSSMVRCGRMDGMLKLAASCLTTRTWSDAFGHYLVATGRIEGMVDPAVSRWDISAMQVIVEEAGGSWSALDGRPGLFEEALSSNGALHEALVRAFAP